MPKKDSCKKEKKDSLKEEFAELKETLQRVQAEFENSRKRMEKEKQGFLENANASIVKELLPLLDSIEAADEKLNQQADFSKEDSVKGMELIKKQLLSILESHGLEQVPALGKRFDPMLHEAVMQVSEKGKQEGLVLEELQKGYTLNGRVLRHAKVRVNKPEEGKGKGE